MKILSTTALMLTMSLCGASYAIADWHGKDGPPAPMQEAISTLPAEKAEQFRSIMKPAFEQNRELHRQIHQLHEELHAILVAPQFDKNAFVTKNAQLQELHNRQKAAIDLAFANAAASLSQSERSALADAMHKRHDAHSAHGPDGASPPPPENGF